MIPGLEWVADLHGGTWKPLINGYLPVVALLGLILLLPLIFNAVATLYERRKTLSSVQNSIVGRFFYYQLANIYITVTAGAIWTSLAEIIDHPQNLLVILGEALPTACRIFHITAHHQDSCWLANGIAKTWCIKPNDVSKIVFQQEKTHTTRTERSIQKATYILWLGVPNTVSSHHHMFYICVYNSFRIVFWCSILCRCFIGI